ncbi:leukotriene C4 synthase-like [Haliotis rubra]|uniref:leukotriene C4 synthase-like n=1 Tax=Haliotis rubra TaxID=36100 RepID=UPI001EE5C681|nr:leukotriene C4 synthase-like [Haliotis rubra]
MAGDSVGTPLLLEDMVFPALITVLAALHLSTIARRVGLQRIKLKISLPNTTGDPVFERTFRAHQNCSEFFPIFLSVLWVSAIFFHPGLASLVGVVYMFFRENYFNGYKRSPKERLPGFIGSIICLFVLVGTGLLGTVTLALRRYG